MTIRRSTKYHPEYGSQRAQAALTTVKTGGSRQCAYDVWSRLSAERMSQTATETVEEAHILRGCE